MQQPPYPPAQSHHPYGPMPPPPPGRAKPKQPWLVWFFVAMFLALTLYYVGTTIYALVVPKTQAKAYIVYHFDKENQSSVYDGKTFEAQGLVHIFFSCDYSIDIGEDVTFEVKRLDVPKTVWRKSIDCPHTDGAMVTVESGSYEAAVYAAGDVNWTFSVYQTL